MESAIVDVLEDSVMTIEGIRNVSSVSMEGFARITIEFELSRDIDSALQEVQTKIFQAQRNLPTDIDPPIVTKSNPEDQPIMFTTLSGDSSLRDKIIFVRNHLKDRDDHHRRRRRGAAGRLCRPEHADLARHGRDGASRDHGRRCHHHHQQPAHTDPVRVH